MPPACGYVGVGGARDPGIVAGLAGLWGVARAGVFCALTIRVMYSNTWCVRHRRLYHDRYLCCQSLEQVGYAEGVTMMHQMLVQLESIAITVGGPVLWPLSVASWLI